MKNKNIALINYPGHYFSGFAKSLEDLGFSVYWVCINRSDAQFLTKKMGVSASYVLDTTTGFDPTSMCIDVCRSNLAELEKSSTPRVNDVVLMDRVLRRKTSDFALKYIEHLNVVLTKFFVDNDICLITSGRDSALQITSMMVANKLEIPWVVPTRLRIPLETYGFCTGHETDTFIKFRAQSDQDLKWANEVIENFFTSKQRPALKIAARNFKDTVRLLGPHFFVFMDLLKRGIIDRGNDYSRYTITTIIKMYLNRRINMLSFAFSPPWSLPGAAPFCIYALHTQPESSIDVAGSFFSDQVALITFISRSLPANYELYVKVHPTDVDGKSLLFYRAIKNIPSVRLIHDSVDSRSLVANAAIVFTLTGTIGYEAGLMGRSVITFARNYYNELPTVHYCESPPQLPSLITSILHERNKSFDEIKRDIVDFLAKYRPRVFNGEVNRMFGTKPTTLNQNDLETLKNAYSALYQELVLSKNKKELRIVREIEVT